MRADPARRSLSSAGFHPLPVFLSLSTDRAALRALAAQQRGERYGCSFSEATAARMVRAFPTWLGRALMAARLRRRE